MVQQRLPAVNGDDGQWGDILNQYLTKEHYDTGLDNVNNGGHKTITIRPGTAAAGTAPLKFSAGTLLGTPEPGAVEFTTNHLFFTITSGAVRKKVALYDDAAGATGDMYYRDSSGNLVRLPAGVDGKTLKVSGGLPTWSDVAGSTFATSTKTVDYTITGTDVVIFADASSGNVTITLASAAANAGYRFFIKRIDNTANVCQVVRSGADTIDGQTTILLQVRYVSLTVVSNGSAWYII